jgi:hypothetical protein
MLSYLHKKCYCKSSTKVQSIVKFANTEALPNFNALFFELVVEDLTNFCLIRLSHLLALDLEHLSGRMLGVTQRSFQSLWALQMIEKAFPIIYLQLSILILPFKNVRISMNLLFFSLTLLKSINKFI